MLDEWIELVANPYFKLSEPHVDWLRRARPRSMSFKPADARKALESKEVRYKKLWDVRLAAQMAELQEFADVFRSVRRALRAASIIGK